MASAVDDPTIYLSAIIENVERLQSGEFSAVGTLELGEGGAEVSQYGEVIDVTFDHPNQLIRFRRVRQLENGAINGRLGNGSTSSVILSPDKSIEVGRGLSGKASVSIKNPCLPRELPEFQQPVFDVRSLGLVEYGLLSTRIDEVMPGIARLWESAQVVDEAGGELLRVELNDVRYPDQNLGVRVTIWLDRRQGLQPIRTTYTAMKFDAEEIDEPPKPYSSTEISWIEFDGVWVPDSTDISAVTSAGQQRLRLGFEWKSVNRAIPDESFQVSSLDLPNKTAIADLRLSRDQPVLIGRIGEVLERDVPSEVPGKTAGHWVLMLNIAIGGILLGWLVRRKFFDRRDVATRNGEP